MSAIYSIINLQNNHPIRNSKLNIYHIRVLIKCCNKINLNIYNSRRILGKNSAFGALVFRQDIVIINKFSRADTGKDDLKAVTDKNESNDKILRNNNMAQPVQSRPSCNIFNQ